MQLHHSVADAGLHHSMADAGLHSDVKICISQSVLSLHNFTIICLVLRQSQLPLRAFALNTYAKHNS